MSVVVNDYTLSTSDSINKTVYLRTKVEFSAEKRSVPRINCIEERYDYIDTPSGTYFFETPYLFTADTDVNSLVAEDLVDHRVDRQIQMAIVKRAKEIGYQQNPSDIKHEIIKPNRRTWNDYFYYGYRSDYNKTSS